MEVRRPGRHGLAPRWCVATTAAAVFQRALLCTPSTGTGAEPDASRASRGGLCEEADGCAPGMSPGAPEQPLGHCTPPSPCARSAQWVWPLAVTAPPRANPGLTPIAGKAVPRPARSASAPDSLLRSCRSPPGPGFPLPTPRERHHCNPPGVSGASWPQGRHWASTVATEQEPLGVALETQPVFRPRAPVCVDPARRWLFLADTPNNRIVIASLDSGAIQGVRGHPGFLAHPGMDMPLDVPTSLEVPISQALLAVPTCVYSQIGSGVPGVADGTWESAEFNGPSGLALDAQGNALYVADSKGRAVRRVSLGEPHDDHPTGRQVLTVQPPPAPPPPRPTFLQRTWHYAMYLLFLTEPPPDAAVIPAATTYYTRPRMPGAAHPESWKGSADGAGEEGEVWRLAWGPQGKDTLLVADPGCTRAWSLHLPSLKVSPLDVAQWGDPALPGSSSSTGASIAHYFDAAERAASSASGLHYSISEAGTLTVDSSGVQAQDDPLRAVAGSHGPPGAPGASGIRGGGTRELPLTNLSALGVPPRWVVPAEPLSLLRYTEQGPVSDSSGAAGVGPEEAPGSQPGGNPGGVPASDHQARTEGSVFRLARVVGRGRHRGVLRVGVPAGWRLAEPLSAATAWVQCRGSALELSALGGRLVGSRVSWAQEWRDQLEADRWMEAVGDDQEGLAHPLGPPGSEAAAGAGAASGAGGGISGGGGDIGGWGEGSPGPGRPGGEHGESGGEGSISGRAFGGHAAGEGFDGVHTGGPFNDASGDDTCINFFLDASPGQAQVIIDAALLLAPKGPSLQGSGAATTSVRLHRLHAKIDLEIREEGPEELDFTFQLGQAQ